jgi:hypothetical protein
MEECLEGRRAGLLDRAQPSSTRLADTSIHAHVKDRECSRHIELLAVAAHQALAALTVHFHIACTSAARACLSVVHDIDGSVITKQMHRGHLRQAGTRFGE